jgi:3-hydroxyisobutyrate dehydrogenase-like beta-hydroxyacid dehydrogenase
LSEITSEWRMVERRATTASVGVIGLGRIGLPVALNLLERAHTVVGFRRSGSAALAAAGGVAARDAREVAERATTIFTVLPSAEALDNVVATMLPALDGRHVVVELGSHPLADKQRAPPLFDTAAELYRSAIADGRTDQDIACVIDLLDTRKGRDS